MRRSPRGDRRFSASRPPTAVITVLVLIAATIGTFLYLARDEVDRDEERRSRYAEETASALVSRVDAYVEVLFGVRGHLATADDDPGAFGTYMGSLDLDRRLPAARVVGTALAGDGRVGSDEQLIISHVHPVERNEAMRGLDLASIPEWTGAISRARDGGGPVATPPTRLPQSADDQPSVLVMVPIYDSAETPSTTQMRRAGFRGVVYAAIQMGDLVAGLGRERGDAEVSLRDLGVAGTAAANPRLLHDPAGSDVSLALDLTSPDVATVEVAGRRWALLSPDDDGGVGALGGGLKWGVALGGVLITALVIVAMVAADRAERANKTKSQFLSRMSHELRTPLNAVIGFAQVIQMEDTPPETAAQAAHIEGAGRHLLTLIDDVLQISRIEALEFRFAIEPVRAGDVVDEVAQLLAPQARSAGVTLDHSRRDTDALIEVDRQRLVQVLLNLGSNAIKYNRPEGHVEIGTRRLSHRTLRILVRDTGIGIPADQHKRLFAPFDRLGAEATGVEGNGLGLSLSKGLVTAMGGEIGFQSAAGAGSTFWVDFDVVEAPAPVATDTPDDPAPQPPGSRRSGDGVVLCVEDNEANLALVTDALAPVDGLTLLVARTGAEAMAVLSATRVDLLLLDVDLPDIDGADLLARARATTDRPLPAVVLSADATTATVRRLEKAGADEYLTKPVDITHLIETVHHHLGAHDAEPATTGAKP